MRRLYKCPECSGDGKIVTYRFDKEEGTCSSTVKTCNFCNGKKKLAHKYIMRLSTCRHCNGKGAISCKDLPEHCEDHEREKEYLKIYKAELRKLTRNLPTQHYRYHYEYRIKSVRRSVDYWSSRTHYFSCDYCHRGSIKSWVKLKHKHQRSGQKKKSFGRKAS